MGRQIVALAGESARHLDLRANFVSRDFRDANSAPMLREAVSFPYKTLLLCFAREFWREKP